MSIPAFGSKKPLFTQKSKPLKKLKDPQAPKKPITSFIAFSMAERVKIKEDLGNLSVAEVGKELGRRWTELNVESKAVYELASKQAKQRFDEEMKSYQPSEEFIKKKAEIEARSASVAAESSAVSVRTVEAYFAFLFSNWRQVQSGQPDQSAKDIQDLVWQRWNSVDTSDKSGSSSMPQGQKKPRKVRDPLAPKKPLSSYFLYINSVRTEVVSSMPELSHREVMVELGKRWSELDVAAKSPFLARAEELKVEYLLAMEKYKLREGGEEVSVKGEEPSPDRLGREELKEEIQTEVAELQIEM